MESSYGTHTSYTTKPKTLESAQKEAVMVILRVMKSTPTKEL